MQAKKERKKEKMSGSGRGSFFGSRRNKTLQLNKYGPRGVTTEILALMRDNFKPECRFCVAASLPQCLKMGGSEYLEQRFFVGVNP